MKKTFLTFALAGLATAAFAHTSFYKTDAFDAYVDGSLQLDYSNSSVKQSLNGTTTFPTLGGYSEATRLSATDKHYDSYVRLRLGTGLDFKNADGLTAGYYVRLQTKAVNESVKVDGSNKKEVNPETKKAFGKYVDVNRAYAYLGHKDFGTLTVGKLPTVADYGFDYNFNTLKSTPNTVLRNLGLDSAENPTVKYDSANYNGFTFAYSFSSNRSNERTKGYSRVNALHAKYDFGGTVLSATAAFGKDFADEGFASTSVAKKVNAYEVALENTSLVDGLYLGLAYDYAKETWYENLANDGKVTHNQLSGKVAYTLNQYFTPYAVLSYEKVKENSGAVENKKVFVAAVGAQSTVYKLDSLNVNLFAEAFYQKEKTNDFYDSPLATSNGVNYPTVVTGKAKEVNKGFAVGAVVKF